MPRPSRRQPVADSPNVTPPDFVFGVRRFAPLVQRLRAALKAYTEDLGACPWSDAEIGRDICAQRHEVSGSLAHLKNKGEVRTVIRTIDVADPRFAGRELRTARRALVYVQPVEQAEPPAVRRELDEIENELQRRLGVCLQDYRDELAAARTKYRAAVGVLKAQATIDRFAAKKNPPAPPSV